MATTNPIIATGLAFDQLRTEGVRLIHSLSSGRWTDVNTHDPGMTLLDVLCYALTDLAYRSNWSIPDLLGLEGMKRLKEGYGREKALPSAPVTMADLRKKLLDIRGVLNVHIEPFSPSPSVYYHPYEQGIGTIPVEGVEAIAIKGFYRVFIAGLVQSKEVTDVLNAHRPLCCDWSVTYLDSEPLKLVINLEIASDVSLPKQLATAVKEAVSQYITPSVKFTSYLDEQHRGTPTDKIYEGPLLKHGFLADSEMTKLEVRTSLRVSDLIQILMDIAGVVAVKDIYFETKDGKPNPWLQPLTLDKYPILDGLSEIYLNRSNQQTLFKAKDLQATVLPVALNSSNQQTLSKATGLQATVLPVALNDAITDPIPQKETPRSIGHYYSIRHHFPAIYGLHDDDLADMTVSGRQMSGYLILFEQLLSDSFAQLAQAGQLFDFDNTTLTNQAVQLLPNAEAFMMLPSGQKAGTDGAVFLTQLRAALQKAAVPPSVSNDRFNRLLDHLMARFAENMADYSLLMYDKPQELIEDKRAFVRHLPNLGLNRSLGSDYTLADSRSGLEQRIALLLGMSVPLTGVVDNFFMVEHLLLTPVEQDVALGDTADTLLIFNVAQPDPYSRILSFVFPEASDKIKDNAKWQKLTAQTVRRETPAHLQTNILWLPIDKFTDFSTAWTAWRKALANPLGINNQIYRVARDRVSDLLFEFVAGQNQFLLGWHIPILDLTVEIPFVAANIAMPAVILSSQAGVEYTLCNYQGQPIQPIVKVQGTGNNLPILLPPLTEDTTFRILASKKKASGEIVSGLLFQKLRVRVGTDVNIPVTILSNQIRFNTTARLDLRRSQAQVLYRLLDRTGSVLSTDVTGLQDQPVSLTSTGLTVDIDLFVQAERGAKKDLLSTPG